MVRRRAALLGAILTLVLAWSLVGLAGPKPQVVTLTAGTPANEFAFVPKEITITAGQPVTLILVNKGKLEHDLYIERLKVKIPPAAAAMADHVVAPGKSASVTFTPTRKGTYEFVCQVPGHKEAGMTGVLIVK